MSCQSDPAKGFRTVDLTWEGGGTLHDPTSELVWLPGQTHEVAQCIADELTRQGLAVKEGEHHHRAKLPHPFPDEARGPIADAPLIPPKRTPAQPAAAVTEEATNG